MSRSRALRVALGALVLAMLGGSHVGADDDNAVRVIAGVGVAVPIVNHRLYDVGVLAHGGADLPLGNHRLIVEGGWVDLATAGARVDVGLVEASWRVSPSWARGVRFDVGSGFVLEVERFQLEVPGQGVSMSTMRGGMPASVAIGIGLGRWVELELGFRQLLYFNAPSHSPGIAHGTIAGRL